jgi:Carboxypeptidase regulatory-like domain/TonB dependent receptor
MKRLQFCLAVFAVLALTLSAFAQVQNGQFAGTVTDPTGAAVPNAKVTVTNEGTNLAVSATTNSSGNFTVRELPVGTYTLTAEASGFKKVSDTRVVLNAGVIAHVDFKMALGQASEVVEVTGAVAQVDTEDSKLAATVGATQIASLPLNGRNVFDLIQMQPGAVNVNHVMSENGANTVVNGVREDFNGFLLNGVANKDLSGGVVNQPIVDTVQEFQMVTLNMSAQYGNSAGSVTNLVSKGGTNQWHGSGFEFLRNDALDANDFFFNQAGVARQPLRFNQFGGTFGGPILKDKLFFFGAYQGERFKTSQPAATVTVESPDWRAAVQAADPNSVASLLYKNFAPSNIGTPNTDFPDLDSYVNGGSPAGVGYGSGYLCDAYLSASPTQGLAMAQRMAKIIGVTAQDQTDQASAGCTVLPIQTGTFPRTGKSLLYNSVVLGKSRTQDNLFNGNEGSLRIDWTASSKDRVFTQMNSLRSNDEFNSGGLNQAGRGFNGPVKNWDPNFQFSEVHTFSPTVLNEFRAGYAATIQGFSAGTPGVPQINFADGSMGFGAYSGYPQTFHDNIYSYSDMVSVTHGNHNVKVGADIRRNIENSQFSVGRPYYYFYDPILFGADAPVEEDAGVDPGLATNPSAPVAQLAENKRHWRNWEVGIYGQDDWKVTHRLTLNLGLRWDLYTRHTEAANKATTFIPGPGVGFVDQVQNANQFFGTGTCIQPVNEFNSILAGECGPGGFAPTKHLSTGDHNNFGPRVGFAWDVFGNGKTSIRGGFGISYEGTLYNPLSNSRWNPPYYSFNAAQGSQEGGNQVAIYGPQSGGAPSFTGPPDPLNFQGVGVQATGNINGWAPTNLNQAVRTGIVFNNLRDPYVYNFFYSIQHEIAPKMVLEVDYVGTAGHKLFRAENINRDAGGRLPIGLSLTDNLGRSDMGRADFTTNPVDTSKQINPTGKVNPNYGNLRSWLNVVNSNYNSLQVALKHQGFHGLLFNFNYTYGHSIDGGSTWHSGATSANGAAAGEGYTSDVRNPGLDRGNSIYDVRHRVVANFVWELPFLRGSHSFAGKVAGGWQLNGIWSFQTGAHWEPFTGSGVNFKIPDPANPGKFITDTNHLCRSAATFVSAQCTNRGGDYNLDGVANDRPDAQAKNVNATHDMWANGWGTNYVGTGGFFSIPCGGTGPCQGSLGRNTFVGPNYFGMDMSLFKNFQITERVNFQFRVESFNLLNRANFELPGNAGHNKITDPLFGTAGGAFPARQIQFGAKISF